MIASGGDQEAAELDQAVAGAHGGWGGRGGSVTAAQVNTGLWLADNVNSELWLVADTMTQGTGVTTDQSAGPGYNDTEDRDELTNAETRQWKSLKWIWVVTWIFHAKLDLITWILTWNLTSPE